MDGEVPSAPDGRNPSSPGGGVPSAPGGGGSSAQRGRCTQGPQLSGLQPHATSPWCHQACFSDSSAFPAAGPFYRQRESLCSRDGASMDCPSDDEPAPPAWEPSSPSVKWLQRHQPLRCGRQESRCSQEGRERRGGSPGFRERLRIEAGSVLPLKCERVRKLSCTPPSGSTESPAEMPSPEDMRQPPSPRPGGQVAACVGQLHFSFQKFRGHD